MMGPPSIIAQRTCWMQARNDHRYPLRIRTRELLKTASLPEFRPVLLSGVTVRQMRATSQGRAFIWGEC